MGALTFNWREVFFSESAPVIAEAEKILHTNNIPSKVKTVNRNVYGLKARRTVLGTFGEKLSAENQYYLLVHKKDQETAEYLIRKWKQERER